MRVLLLQSFLGRKEQLIMPLGLLSLGRYLSMHEVSLLDLNVVPVPFETLKSELLRVRPDLVGISFRNIDTTDYNDMFLYYQMLSTTISIIRDTAEHIPIVIGGAGFSLYAQDIMARHPEIDFGAFLEAEESFPELLENLSRPWKVRGVWYRRQDKLIFSGDRKPFDFSCVRSPRLDLIRKEDYCNDSGLSVQSKRGCMLGCAYCTYPFLAGHSVQCKPVAQVVNEMQDVSFRGASISFADSVFNLPKEHAVEVCEEIIRRKFVCRWSAYFSIKGADEEFIRLAHRAGCMLFVFSPDGYSNRAMKCLNKEVSFEEYKNTYSLVKRLHLEGAKFEFNFFFNAPGTRYMDILRLLIAFATTNILLPRRKYMHLKISFPRLEPHTPLHQMAVREGTLPATMNLLPEKQEQLKQMYYSNPDVRYAQHLYSFLFWLKSKFSRQHRI